MPHQMPHSNEGPAQVLMAGKSNIDGDIYTELHGLNFTIHLSKTAVRWVSMMQKLFDQTFKLSAQVFEELAPITDAIALYIDAEAESIQAVSDTVRDGRVKLEGYIPAPAVVPFPDEGYKPPGGWNPPDTVNGVRFRTVNSISPYNQGWCFTATNSNPNARLPHDDKSLWYTGFDGTNWTTDQKIPHNMSSGVAPALAAYNNRLYCVHLSSAGKELWYTSFDGNSWTPGETIPGATSKGAPALAVYNNQLWCVHRSSGPDYDKSLWYSYFNGTNWSSEQEVLGARTNGDAALAVYNNKLYCVHLSSGDDKALWYSSFDGSNWDYAKQIPNVFSDATPALAVYDNRLFCVHRSSNGDKALYYTSFDGSNWDPAHPLQASSDAAPGLGVYDNKLYCAHLSARGEQFVYLTSFDGRGWGPDQMVQGGAIRSTTTPALAAYNNKLCMVHRGSDVLEEPIQSAYFSTSYDGNAMRQHPQDFRDRTAFPALDRHPEFDSGLDTCTYSRQNDSWWLFNGTYCARTDGSGSTLTWAPSKSTEVWAGLGLIDSGHYGQAEKDKWANGISCLTVDGNGNYWLVAGNRVVCLEPKNGNILEGPMSVSDKWSGLSDSSLAGCQVTDKDMKAICWADNGNRTKWFFVYQNKLFTHFDDDFHYWYGFIACESDTQHWNYSWNAMFNYMNIAWPYPRCT
ncbi:hypothetical protein [Streptomyces violascens]|uniref:hypothetical protein n=1 Tax=Streptomyces violascens TaxID=67381 RepID=UPI0036C4A5A8